MYTKSLSDLTAKCAKLNIEVVVHFIFNESLVTRARNYLVDEFLRSDCTHLMFIDSDIGFQPDDVLSLASLSADDSDYDIICGPYPKKTISWEKIASAVNQGFADNDPRVLARFVGDYVFNPAKGQTQIRLDEPVEVLEAGTGFMMIQRQALEKYAESYPELHYLPDHVRTANFDGSRKIVAFFDTVIDPDSERYLSEDYMFCQYSRKAGLKVWLCPWMSLSHMGTYNFSGSLRDLAQINAHATANVKEIKK